MKEITLLQTYEDFIALKASKPPQRHWQDVCGSALILAIVGGAIGAVVSGASDIPLGYPMLVGAVIGLAVGLCVSLPALKASKAQMSTSTKLNQIVAVEKGTKAQASRPRESC